MNDIYMARVVSGLYDVPLEGHKPRFGQPRRNQNHAPPQDRAPIYQFRARSTPFNSSSGMPAVLKSATARPATREASLARAPARDHAHRRDLLYL